MIEATLQKFLAINKNLLRKDYYVYCIISYLALWRLDEIGFSNFERFVQGFSPKVMHQLISFLFNPHKVQTELKILWCTMFDEEFVAERIMDPILHHLPHAQQLAANLYHLSQNGMGIRNIS